MIRTNVFGEVPVPGGIPRDPAKIMKMGLNVVELAAKAQERRTYGLSRGSVNSHDGTSVFEVVSWDRWLPQGTIMSIVDKRKIRAGMLLTVHALTDHREISAVQAYVVNDEFPNAGLRRIVNMALPFDATPSLIDGLHGSTMVVDIDGRPDPVQLEDYSKALSTVLKTRSGQVTSRI